jgi:hypothetical protein
MIRMTFINWADSEEMVGLLAEYVADERNDSQEDLERERFLAELSAELSELAGQFTALSAEEGIARLRAIHCSRTDDFVRDPVLTHVEACIEELERINGQS